MHIQLIGEDMSNFLKLISDNNNSFKAKQKIEERKFIEDFWDFDYSINKEVKVQVDEYFQYLEDKIKNDEKLKEVLIVKIPANSNKLIEEDLNTFKEKEYILEKLDILNEDYKMPIVLFLVVEEKKKILKKYERKYPNLIISTRYSEDPKLFQENGQIKNLLLRFCSIHNNLGETFSIGEDLNSIGYDLIENYYPFNINICCLGKSGQGKSTGVNTLLNDYKAKESSDGSSQTKKITIYQVKDAPLKIIDVPGFDSDENIMSIVNELKDRAEEINKLKYNIHFFLYFLKYSDNRMFSEYERPIIEEINKYKDSKVIYVITHSYKNANEKFENEKLKRIKKINNSINSLRDLADEKKKMMYADNDNVIFVNFHKDSELNIKEFGKKELFKKLYYIFINSNFYKKNNDNFSKEKIDEQISILKERAYNLLLWNRIGGAIIGVLPGIDWLVQRYVIKYNTVKKIGQVFGINIKFIDEQNKIQNKVNKEDGNIFSGMDLNLEIDGDKIIK
jgi:GTP-binding protein EngB required for normal cell division